MTNLFVFNFKGETIYAKLNYPGLWHDVKLASDSVVVTPFLSEKNSVGNKVLGESAFAGCIK